MLKLFIKDHETGKVHEYGTNPHDSLIVNDNGSIHYYNLQNGEGTMFGAYCFCDNDGNDLRTEAEITNPAAITFLDIAETEDESVNLINACGDNIKIKVLCFLSDLVRELSRIVDVYRKQGYTYEEIKAILTAPDEGVPESLQGTAPQTGENPHA